MGGGGGVEPALGPEGVRAREVARVAVHRVGVYPERRPGREVSVTRARQRWERGEWEGEGWDVHRAGGHGGAVVRHAPLGARWYRWKEAQRFVPVRMRGCLYQRVRQHTDSRTAWFERVLERNKAVLVDCALRNRYRLDGIKELPWRKMQGARNIGKVHDSTLHKFLQACILTRKRSGHKSTCLYVLLFIWRKEKCSSIDCRHINHKRQP